jgi:hypothetical protein
VLKLWPNLFERLIVILDRMLHVTPSEDHLDPGPRVLACLATHEASLISD